MIETQKLSNDCAIVATAESSELPKLVACTCFELAFAPLETFASVKFPRICHSTSSALDPARCPMTRCVVPTNVHIAKHTLMVAFRVRRHATAFSNVVTRPFSDSITIFDSVADEDLSKPPISN